MSNYFNWQIDGNRASRRMPDGRGVAVDLHHGYGVMAEGWWPEKPPLIPSAAISGVCLWNANWLVRLDSNHGGKPEWKSPALPAERGDISRDLQKGRRRIGAIRMPAEPNEYHTKLIKWQAQKIRDLGIGRVLYALPTPEYHEFVRSLEEESGTGMEECHVALDVFAASVKEMVLEEFSGAEIVLVSPFGDGIATDCEESFKALYAHPDLYGASADDLIGVEDLAELRLTYNVTRGAIPVVVAVIKIPHPYTEKGHGDFREVEF